MTTSDELIFLSAAGCPALRRSGPAGCSTARRQPPPVRLAGRSTSRPAPAPPKLRPAIAAALQKSARNGAWLTTLQGKSRRVGKPARPVTIYVCTDFARILDAVPKNDVTTICVKENGQPWTLEGFKTAWGRYRDAMLKRELIGPGVTFHGLRHTAPTILEEAGFDESQTKHQLGHGPRTVSGHYGMTAERRALLREMALTLQEALRKARGNVVRIGNESV